MEKEERELEESVYSSLNVGSFLERKRKEQNKKTDAPKKEVVKITPLVKEEPKKEVVTKKIVTAIEEQKIEPKKNISNVKTTPSVAPKSKETNLEKKQTIHELIEERKKEMKKPVLESSQKKESTTKKEPQFIVKSSDPETENQKKEIESPKVESENHLSKESMPKTDSPIKEEKTKETSNKKEAIKKSEKKKLKKEKKNSKMGKGLLIGLVICMIMDLFAITGLFLAYGPVSYFRNLLITSAMTTMSHKYLARTFYDDNIIEKVLSENIVKEIEENTNSNDINFDNATDTGEYASIYEEQILKRDKNQLYKIIDIEENGYIGYLIAIYDASRVELAGANDRSIYGGAFLTDISKRTKAKVAINASGFYNAGGNKGSTAVGTVIMDGKVILNGKNANFGGGLAGFNKDHVLVLTRENPQTAIKNGMVDAVEFGPFLIVNGKAAEIKGDGGWGLSSRTVLAQRKDGIVLFLVIDGRRVGHSIGIDMNGLIKILKRYNAHNAVNLDGGGSTTLVVDGKLKNKPCCSVDPTSKQRYVPNAWIVK